MPYYKHYSFDLWLTLIRSNPAYKPQRTGYFFKHFNRSGKTYEEVARIFRRVDIMCNRINEKTGGNIRTEEIYLLAVSEINDYDFQYDDLDLGKIYDDLEEILLENLPFLYDAHTKETLHFLAENTDATIGLLSNTGFIKGRTLRKVLDKLEIGRFLDFQIYSDEAGISKPNPLLFAQLLHTVEKHHDNNKILPKDILHIGDNPVADIAGAKNAGMNAFLVNSNSVPLKNLLLCI